ncbi:Hypothetical predicted protein [Lecanosticta acicola]|uniref:Uncharacterized protein n=1 Tax=Lecanosticta acicola TaxID=111012 RepID=A0AAI8YSA7_9PEZI|nr:Hypothetical predicted protein [Lecanosticta acicola]
MTTPGGSSSQRERNAVSPSPARDALQGNLANLTGADIGLTVSKRKSWFGSARTAIFKHVGSRRGDANKTEAGDESASADADGLLDPTPLEDCDVTPLKPSPPRQRTFTPKNAINSLRQHMHHSNQRHKRAALPLAMNEQANQQQDPSAVEERQPSPENDGIDIVSPLKSNEVSPRSQRGRASLSMSLVGSIRGLSRLPTLKYMSPTKRSRDELVSPTKEASQVPLPSSPIRIKPPPTLSLDLGPAALVSSNFGRFSPEIDRASTFFNLTDPSSTANVDPLQVYGAQIVTAADQGLPGTGEPESEDLEKTYSDIMTRIKLEPSSYIISREEFAVLSIFMDRVHGDEAAEQALMRYWSSADVASAGCSPAQNVPTYYTRIPGEGPQDQQMVGQRQSVRPSDVLNIPVDDFGVSQPSGPSTPLPGTGQMFDFDGANDSTELFERSVEYKDKKYKKENRKLKKMVSLDAMAEECANTPSYGLSTEAERSRQKRLSTLTTVNSIPEDMCEITRQAAHLQTPSAGHRNPATGEWQSDDPFAPGNVVGNVAESGVPSPTRSVKLPLRPKITLQAADPTQQMNTTLGGKPSSLLLDNAAATLALASDSDAGEYGDFKAQHCLPDLGKEENPEYDSPSLSDSGMSLAASFGRAASLADLVSTTEVPAPQARSGIACMSSGNDVFGSPWKFRSWREAAPANMASPDDSPATTAFNRTPDMGEREEFDLKRSQRNMRYNALCNEHSSDPEHEDDARPPSAFPSPLRPRLCLNTGDLRLGRRTYASSPKKDIRHTDVGMSSDSVDTELKVMVAQHYQFKDHIDAIAPSDNVGLAASGGFDNSSSLTPTENPFSPASEAYSSHLSPNSKKIWSNVVRTPFHTPPAVSPASSKHPRKVAITADDDGGSEQGEVCTYDFDLPEADQRRDSAAPFSSEGESTEHPDSEGLTDTLDDCLKMFRSFNHSQGQLPSKSSEATIKVDGQVGDTADPFSSPDSGYNADKNSPSPGTGSAGKKKPPARYRSIRGIRKCELGCKETD